jgi:hypothetical protein
MCPVQCGAFEFVADEPGDWAVYSHKCHHTRRPWVTAYGATSASTGWRAAGPHPSGALAGGGRVQAMCTTCEGAPRLLPSRSGQNSILDMAG